MKKEEIQRVYKVWGSELWVVNNEKYCGKLLYLDKGATSSYHFHKKKQETFYALHGQVALTVDGRNHMLHPFSRPKTIMPYEQHKFYGITEAVLLEISTYHDKDIVRLTESISGMV